MKYKESDLRKYNRNESIVFRKTKELYGGLSNMAAGYPVYVNGVEIRTIEALYQACRFPDNPEIQQKIIEQKSPMAAKMVGKPHRQLTRSDWDKVRVNVMRWCLRVKLSQNWEKFREVLESTGEKAIVEESKRDQFWGAKQSNDGTLIGINVLGRLLMELREEYYNITLIKESKFKKIEIEKLYLYGKPIINTEISIDFNSNNIKSSCFVDEIKKNNYQQMTIFDKEN